MKVKKLIEILNSCNHEAEVKMHGFDGEPILISYGYSGKLSNTVVVLGEDDFDVADELESYLNWCFEENIDEYDAYWRLEETGFTLDIIEKYCPNRIEAIVEFCKTHALYVEEMKERGYEN